MRGGTFIKYNSGLRQTGSDAGVTNYFNAKEVVVASWLAALDDSRSRTISALKGLNPQDAIVALLHEKHKMLIGEPTAERILITLGEVGPEEPRVMSVKGRNLVNGRPGTVSITSIEVQAADNSQATLPYIDWVTAQGEYSIGKILYMIAANEMFWLFEGILQQSPPAELTTLFERESRNMVGNTMAQHHQRMNTVRDHLIQIYSEMTLEDFQRIRRGQDTFCTPEWVIHELCQYEAEWRGEISSLYAAAQQALNLDGNY